MSNSRALEKKNLIQTKSFIPLPQQKLTDQPHRIGGRSGFDTLVSPGHNHNWIYDDVNQIFKMAPKPRYTIQVHFSALCYA